MALLPFQKPRVTDPDPRLPERRRVVWEHFGDTRILNTWLLLISTLAIGACLVLGTLVFTLSTRPPSVLADDQGYVMWRTSEVFRLGEDNVRMFHELVLGKLLNSNPSSYDISSLAPLAHPVIIEKFSGAGAGQSDARLRSDKRQVYTLYEIRRTSDPRYPQYLAFVTRGETTVYEERRDQAGNVRVYPQSEISIWVTFIETTRPVPQNPWGFRLVGVERRTGARGEKTWVEGTPVAGSALPGGAVIQPSKTTKP